MATARADPVPGDPVLQALGPAVQTQSTRLTPRAIAIVVIASVVTAIGALGRPAFSLSGQPVPASFYLDPGQMAAYSFVVVPVVLFLYFWLPGSIESLLQELLEQGVIGSPKAGVDEPIETFAEHAARRFGRRVSVATAAILIVGYTIERLLRDQPSSPAALVQECLDVLGTAPIIYAATLAFFWVIDGIQITTSLFGSYNIRVQPHHPDGAGGLSPVGRRVSILGYAGAILGLAFVYENAIMLRNGFYPFRSPESVFGVGSLLVVTPLVIWFWLRAPHEAMLDARKPLLADVAAAYESNAPWPVLDGDDTAAITGRLKESTDLLKELDRRAEEITLAYPTWPISTSGLRTVRAVVVAPIVAGIVSVAIDGLRTVIGGG